jgi:hypothetical protein
MGVSLSSLVSVSTNGLEAALTHHFASPAFAGEIFYNFDVRIHGRMLNGAQRPGWRGAL